MTAGRHEIVLRVDWCTSPVLELDMGPGDCIQLSCAPGGSPAAGLADALANVQSYISLSRV